MEWQVKRVFSSRKSNNILTCVVRREMKETGWKKIRQAQFKEYFPEEVIWEKIKRKNRKHIQRESFILILIFKLHFWIKYWRYRFQNRKYNSRCFTDASYIHSTNVDQVSVVHWAVFIHELVFLAMTLWSSYFDLHFFR